MPLHELTHGTRHIQHTHTHTHTHAQHTQNACLCMNSLTELDISNNKLQSLPPALSFNTNLRKLHISTNAIISIPPLVKLWSLSELHASRNRLKNVPALPCSLRVLLLDGNEIQCLPDAIREFLCFYVCVYVCVCMSMFVYVRANVCIYTHTYIYTYRARQNPYVSTCVSMYYVCVCV